MKKPIRNKVKYPGLKKQYNSKVKQEYMDIDYIDKLSEDQKLYMSDFLEEYYGANLDFKDLKNNRFHKTKEEKKHCTDRNNARNRCVYGIAKAGGKMNNDNMIDDDIDMTSEDTLIQLIDNKKITI